MWKKFRSGNKWSFKELIQVPEKNRLLIFLLIGVLLVVIALPTSNGDSSGEESGETSDPAPTGVQEDYEAYEARLEEKLEQVLSQVNGVGNVDVMLTLKSTGERVVEKDSQSESQTIQEEDSSGGSRSTKDSSLNQTSIYEQSSDGSQSPYVSKEMTPEVEGVIVIADGGDNAVIVQEITEAAQALFGVDAHKIKVMKRNDS